MRRPLGPTKEAGNSSSISLSPRCPGAKEALIDLTEQHPLSGNCGGNAPTWTKTLLWFGLIIYSLNQIPPPPFHLVSPWVGTRGVIL